MSQQTKAARRKAKVIAGPSKGYGLADGEYVVVEVVKENGKNKLFMGPKKRKQNVIRRLDK